MRAIRVSNDDPLTTTDLDAARIRLEASTAAIADVSREIDAETIARLRELWEAEQEEAHAKASADAQALGEMGEAVARIKREQEGRRRADATFILIRAMGDGLRTWQDMDSDDGNILWLIEAGLARAAGITNGVGGKRPEETTKVAAAKPSNSSAHSSQGRGLRRARSRARARRRARRRARGGGC